MMMCTRFSFAFPPSHVPDEPLVRPCHAASPLPSGPLKCQFCLSEVALTGASKLQTLSLSLSELDIELFVKVQ